MGKQWYVHKIKEMEQSKRKEGKKGYSEWSGAKSWQSKCIVLMHHNIVISCQEVTKSGLLQVQH